MKARDFRSRAREALRGNWFVAVIAGMIVTAFSGGGVTIENSSEELPLDFVGLSLSWDVLAPILGIIFVSAVLVLILTSLVTVGYAQFNIDMIDGYKPRIRTLFSKWNQIGTTILASLLIVLRVFVGMIFFFIPGIIEAYKHAMVNHIIAENPGITAREAMRESRRMMKGNKWRLFCLHFSFIGWNLLVAITFGIAGIWVIPYEQAAIAAFYREI